MRHVFLVVAAVSIAAGPAAAQTTYVDAVESYGGLDAELARETVESALRRVGRRAVPAAPDATPCPAPTPCLAERARAVGAERGIRVIIADVAGELTVSIVSVDVAGRMTRRSIPVGAEEGLEDALAAAFGSTARRSRRAAWVTAGVAAALVLAGGGATWHAHQLRDEFFARHVDANGDVIGISPEGARHAEERAQRWAAGGGVLLAVGAATGIAATVLFVRDRGEVRPAGVAVAGRF